MLRRADPRRALRNAVTGQRVERCRNSPSLILDFINQDYRTGLGSYYERHSFSDLITLTRPGSGMRWNAEGNLELVAANEPRFDYDPVTLQPLGLLVEESRTNLCKQSQDLAAGIWSGAAGVSITSNVEVAPDGTTSMDLIELTGATGHQIEYFLDAPLAGNSEVTVSVWLHVVNLPSDYNFQIAYYDGSNFVAGGGISLESSYIGSTVRVSQTITVGAAVVSNPKIRLNGFGGGSDGTSYYCWGVQIEEGGGATSYIPTNGSVATRAADLVAANSIAGFYSPIAGTLLASVVVPDAATSVEICALEDGADYLRFYVASGGQVFWQNINGDSVGTGYFTSNGGSLKCAGGYEGDLRSSVNGGPSSSAARSNPVNTVDRLTVGARNSISGHVREIRYWPVKLSDSELEAVSS